MPLPIGDVAMIAGSAGGEAGTDDDLDLALVVLQRANRRGVAVLQVVPGPADAPAGLGERVVVANHVARDHPDALGLEFRGPALERVPALGMSRVDRRIAVADDDQIAVQRAVRDLAVRWRRGAS